ncbi:ABC transporter substrate-binding protein [Noviherbaspirillum sp.]|uniref:ABC transporter substrate-binding protein n=1 Tax=Noviherbaspirillum sp. TaxID=1926288 RepID=UPI002B48572A|nr:ABC transporter substrate-binding protein [Noviherbaspirillum sp.]HJV82375.1 ABC transporter substrate-binding protein [Noviherbaspirillum sp.]
MKFKQSLLALAVTGALLSTHAMAEVNQVRIVKQYGLGFLPLMVMEDQKLVEKQAKAAGLGDVKGVYLTLSNPSAMNEGLLSGNLDVGTNGPPSVLTIWSRTKGTANEIKGMAGMITTPMWLNVNKPEIKSIRDFKPEDKIAVTSIKVSIPAIIMQMAAAKEWGKENYAKLDPLTVSMSHPDAYAAFLSKRDITAHFTSPPYMYRELEQQGIHRILSSDDVMGGTTTFSMIYSSSKFHDANPKTYKAVLAAFSEAVDFIEKNQKEAAQIYLRVSGDKKSTQEDIEKQIADKNLTFTTTPLNIKKYADFMYDVGSIKNKPDSWKDVFFPEVHDLKGS